MTTSGMPIPMPIFAPLDNPLGLGVMVEELVVVGVVYVGMEDGRVVVGELDKLFVASANAAKSELCHHTGMPSPYTL